MREVVPISLFPNAVLTRKRVSSLEGKLPKFQHKWSRQIREYRYDEIDLPDEIFLNGQIFPLNRKIIGIGGTRSPTARSFLLVSELCHSLANEDIAIMSGGVPGVDLAAHMAALDSSNGVTFAVLANPASEGLSGHEWRSSHLEELIFEKGCFISEYETWEPLESVAFRERLLQRDRIISGLSDAFIAFECSVGSATVDTAMRAVLQGKKVFCIESDPNSSRKGVAELSEIVGIQTIFVHDRRIEDVAAEIKNLVYE